MLAKMFGFLALVMASVNIFGGFLVTQRMLGHVQEERAEEVRSVGMGTAPQAMTRQMQTLPVEAWGLTP